eukprot:TRINITY_DN7343_c0_g1_i1.p1 TRINITY_DN7343_c0_g1~~TRINITY_DN7343_c0_g1_i1.p1  ORF type:complete len:816 (-),score=128.19 TRINITY_DN7343_c0_g1_i1:67-2271(-)
MSKKSKFWDIITINVGSSRVMPCYIEPCNFHGTNMKLLTEQVKENPDFDYADILLGMKTLLNFKENIYGIPFSYNFLLWAYNEQLLAKHDLDSPVVWEDVVYIVETIMESDPNLVPVCISDITIVDFTLSIVASFLQTKPTESPYFNLQNMKPLVDNVGWMKAVEFAKRILHNSTNIYNSSTNNCIFLTKQNDLLADIYNAPQFKIFMPGTREYLDRNTNMLTKCDEIHCPSADDDGVNRVPMSLGGCIAFIPDHLSEVQKDLAVEFLLALSSSDIITQELLEVVEGNTIEPFRYSQMEKDLWNVIFEESNRSLSYSYTLDDYYQVVNNENTALSIRILGIQNYLDYASSVLEAYFQDEITVEEVSGSVYNIWEQLTNRSDLGRVDLLNLYRGAYGMGPTNLYIDTIIYFDSSVGIFTVSLTSVSILYVLFTWSMFVKYRAMRIFSMSSPLFLHLILSGISMVLVSCYMWIGIPSKVICSLRYWLPSVGFCLFYSALLVKNFRIMVLAKTPGADIIKITDAQLIKFLFALLIPTITLLLIWEIVDPIDFRILSIDELRENHYTCYYDSGKYFLLAIMCYFIMLIIWGVLVTVRTFDVIKIVNEAKYIAFATYNTLVAAFIVFLSVLVSSLHHRVLVVVIGLSCGAVGGVAFIFVPKILMMKVYQNRPLIIGNYVSSTKTIIDHVPSDILKDWCEYYESLIEDGYITNDDILELEVIRKKIRKLVRNARNAKSIE